MKTFVLILILSTGSGQEKNVSYSEFNSKETCEAAGKLMLRDTTGFMKDAKYICTEK